MSQRKDNSLAGKAQFKKYDKNCYVEDKEAVIESLRNSLKKESGESLKIVAPISFSHNVTELTFRNFIDYFNVLLQNKCVQKEDGIIIRQVFSLNSRNLDVISIKTINKYTFIEGFNALLISCKILENNFTITLKTQVFDEKVVRGFSCFSEKEVDIDQAQIIDLIYKNSIKRSDFKGKVIDVYGFNVEHGNISKRSFSDIFFGKEIKDEIDLYYNIFVENDSLLRYLLAGRPGYGKTETILALAGELNKRGVTIIQTSINDKISQTFEVAECLAPSIVLLDDIDLSLGNRDRGEKSYLLGLFLECMDGTKKLTTKVGVLATTNSLSLIDAAAKRPGRFNKILIVDSTDEESAKGIIKKSLRKIHNAKDELISEFVDERIIKMFVNNECSGAYIYNAVDMIFLTLKSTKTEINSNNVLCLLKKEIENYKIIENKTKKNTIDYKEPIRDNGIGFKRSDYDLIENPPTPFAKHS